MTQLELFAPEKPVQRGNKYGHLFDVEVDGWMWRAVYRAPYLDETERMTLYRGEINPDGSYNPVSGCHLIRMPYTDNIEDAVKNIRIGEAWINADKTEYGSVEIEDCVDLSKEQPLTTSDYHEDWEPSRHACWDCTHMEILVPGNMSKCWCKLHDHKVCRTAGICSRFEDSGLFTGVTNE